MMKKQGSKIYMKKKNIINKTKNLLKIWKKRFYNLLCKNLKKSTNNVALDIQIQPDKLKNNSLVKKKF